jgi:hypothetical protein
MRTLSRLVLPLAVTAAFAAAFAAPSSARAQARGDEHARFLARETAMWESVQNKQMAPLGRVIASDYAAVYESGIIGRADELAGIEKATLRSVRLDEFKSHHIDADNVLVTYKAVVDGDSNGKSMSGTYNVMTLWHRNGNHWDVAAHSEVKAP